MNNIQYSSIYSRFYQKKQVIPDKFIKYDLFDYIISTKSYSPFLVSLN